MFSAQLLPILGVMKDNMKSLSALSHGTAVTLVYARLVRLI
jgi:hypothetical protein